MGKVWAKVYSRFSLAISLASAAPSTAPLSASFFDSVMAWPLLLRVISTAMSFFGPADAQVHAVDQAVQHVGEVELAVDQLVAHAGPAGFLGGDDLDAVFLVDAQHRGHDDEAQSVSGMKPILTSSFSGLSEPCAQAFTFAPSRLATPLAAAAFRQPGGGRLRARARARARAFRCGQVPSTWIRLGRKAFSIEKVQGSWLNDCVHLCNPRANHGLQTA